MRSRNPAVRVAKKAEDARTRPMNVEIRPPQGRTARFTKKRDAIIAVATEIMNEVGIGGMTFSDVADRVGLSAPSVTYYFKRKEKLAETVLNRGLDSLATHAQVAAKQSTPEARAELFLRLELEGLAKAQSGEAQKRAHIGELRALAEPMGSRLNRRYVDIFRFVRGFFGPDSSPSARTANIVSAHVLLDNIFALPNWLRFYSCVDYPRVCDRMMDIFRVGLAPVGHQWQSRPLGPDVLSASGDKGQDAFLRSATKLINQRGYRGASVDRIASEVQVTKGSFYHHNETKDDLVLDCFDRSYARITNVQLASMNQPGPNSDRLLSALEHLFEIQFLGEEPFLRTASLQLLPSEIKGKALEKSARITRRFTNLVIDGITDGSIRAVDPLIAGQMIIVAINTARDLHHWSNPRFGIEAVPLLEKSLTKGIFHS